MEVKLKEDWIEEKREKFQNQAENADGEEARIYARGFLAFIQDLENGIYNDDLEAWVKTEHEAARYTVEEENNGKEIHFYNAGIMGATESLAKEFEIEI